MVTFEFEYQQFLLHYATVSETRTRVVNTFETDFVNPGNFRVVVQERPIQDYDSPDFEYQLAILSGIRKVAVAYLSYRRRVMNHVYDIIYYKKDDIRIYGLDLESGETHGSLYMNCSSVQQANNALLSFGLIGFIVPC